MLKPSLLEEVKKHDGAVEYLYIDIDKHQQMAQMLKIQSIPVCFMVRKGDLIEQLSGHQQPEKIQEFIQKGLDAGNQWLTTLI